MTIEDSQSQSIKKRWSSRRKDIKPKAITASQQDLIKFGSMNPGQTLPLVVEPNYRHVDLIAWVKNNAELLEAKLLEHGGLLFRGFGLSTQAHFEQFLQALSVR